MEKESKNLIISTYTSYTAPQSNYRLIKSKKIYDYLKHYNGSIYLCETYFCRSSKEYKFNLFERIICNSFESFTREFERLATKRLREFTNNSEIEFDLVLSKDLSVKDRDYYLEGNLYYEYKLDLESFEFCLDNGDEFEAIFIFDNNVNI